MVKSFKVKPNPVIPQTKCPDFDELYEWFESKNASSDKEYIIHHLAECSYCAKKISEWSIDDNLVGAASENEDLTARNIGLKWAKKHKIKKRGPSIQDSRVDMSCVWLIAWITCLGLSFVFKGYYKQFLLSALILGLKWSIDVKQVKSIIHIYRNMQSQKFQDSHRRHVGVDLVDDEPVGSSD